MIRRLDKYAHFLFTLPILILYAIFFIRPLIEGFVYSLLDWDGLSKSFNFIGIQNFVDLLSDRRIHNSLSFTFKYTIALIVLTVVIGILIASFLNNIKKFRSMFRMIYFIPAVLSMITVGLIWNQLFAHAVPFIGDLIGSEVLSQNILSNSSLVFYGVLFVSLWQGLAIPILLFLAALQSVPQELLEAASIDGAGPWQRFKNVVIPYLVPTINIVVILTAKNGLTAFDYIMAMTEGGPGRTTETVGILIYNFAFTEFKYSYANALAMIMFIIIGLISILQIRGSRSYGVNQ